MLNPSSMIKDLSPYGGDFMAFIIIGLAFQQYIDIALHGYYEGLASAYWSSTLEQDLVTPLNPAFFCIAHVAWHLIVRSFITMAYILIGAFFFNIPINASNITSTLLVILLAILSVSGIGLMAASTFTLINAKGWEDPIRWLITTFGALLIGTYYTPNILPLSLQVAGSLLPQTYALDALRWLLIRGSTSEKVLLVHYTLNLDSITVDILALTILVLIYLPNRILALPQGTSVR